MVQYLVRTWNNSRPSTLYSIYKPLHRSNRDSLHLDYTLRFDGRVIDGFRFVDDLQDAVQNRTSVFEEVAEPEEDVTYARQEGSAFSERAEATKEDGSVIKGYEGTTQEHDSTHEALQGTAQLFHHDHGVTRGAASSPVPSSVRKSLNCLLLWRILTQTVWTDRRVLLARPYLLGPILPNFLRQSESNATCFSISEVRSVTVSCGAEPWGYGGCCSIKGIREIHGKGMT